jgi:methyl-accepting chemotaxis protein
VEVFKISQSEGHHTARASVSHASPRPAAKPMAKPAVHGTGSKVGAKKPAVGKSVEHKQPAGVAAGNGKDRHSSGDDFEEF